MSSLGSRFLWVKGGKGGGPGMALDIREEEGGAFLFCLQAFFSTL